ncbi:F0F1 ATP synthase subunit epsilon [Zhihengliuella flava]|uniref:ATP synthase epsilon chain n=1 Tax=Zhihengliuella flava TaxID=1285193 RepID=A0A931GE34_9MICC|nr:F0F1 ATP synthase subunit epsilon [Zhihengliuella flava]MBG6083630.1 F-type H+-transporting ATPase subunit epsilon [Zhihengliuella flava]
MAELDVEIVAADHFVWSGAATLVKARTTDGDIGVMPGHTPVLAVMEAGQLEITPVAGSKILVDSEGGFFSVDNNRVVIVADNAKLQDAASAGNR